MPVAAEIILPSGAAPASPVQNAKSKTIDEDGLGSSHRSYRPAQCEVMNDTVAILLGERRNYNERGGRERNGSSIESEHFLQEKR